MNMRIRPTHLGLGAIALAVSQAVVAGTAPYFYPLTQSAAVASPMHINELNTPLQTPAGLSQKNLMSLKEVEADVNQSIQRANGASASASMFDMLAYEPTGRYLFIPHETPWGAGVSRYDTLTDKTELLFAGDQEALTNPLCASDPLSAERDPTDGRCPAWDFDFGAFDPARWTPWGTLWLGEEWTALGRIVEIMNPLGPKPADLVASAANEGVHWRIVEEIANVAHEGINFSVKDPTGTIYYIDEWNSGSLYMLKLKQPGNLAAGGQTFVLSVDAFVATGGVPAANWNQGSNLTASRFGPATWVPITDADGKKLPGRTWNPFADGPTSDPRTDATARGGRGAADEAGGTPYGRPEDMAVGVLPNGNEMLYVATTSEHALISVEILPNGKAQVRQFASRNTPKNVGFEPTTGRLDSPDNVAIDTLGNVYIIEDEPNGNNIGGDIWFARDMNNDGVAESLDHFMSNQVDGSETTGMTFHPTDPSRFVLAVMHPDSTDLTAVPGGLGDAVWEYDLSKIVPPTCEGPRSQWMTFDSQSRQWVRACTAASDFNFVKMLERNRQILPFNP